MNNIGGREGSRGRGGGGAVEAESLAVLLLLRGSGDGLVVAKLPHRLFFLVLLRPLGRCTGSLESPRHLTGRMVCPHLLQYGGCVGKWKGLMDTSLLSTPHKPSDGA